MSILVDVVSDFEKVSGGNGNKPSSKPKPFSLRLSTEERAYLDGLAGRKPLGAYIREVLLSSDNHKRRSFRKPKVDDKQLALILAALGDSRLASNLNQLAYHANVGALDASEEIEKELHDAYVAVIEMRDTLLAALGLRERKGS